MQAKSALYAVYERAGFVLVRHSKHLIWRCPCGHTQITASVTPGKGRSVANSRGDVTRTLRACRTRQQGSAA